jgi:hypothetical protein
MKILVGNKETVSKVVVEEHPTALSLFVYTHCKNPITYKFIKTNKFIMDFNPNPKKDEENSTIYDTSNAVLFEAEDENDSDFFGGPYFVSDMTEGMVWVLFPRRDTYSEVIKRKIKKY